MGEVEMVVASKSSKQRNNVGGQKLFTALVYSMISLNQCAIARYVPRNSKYGVTPKLVVLIPYRKG